MVKATEDQGLRKYDPQKLFLQMQFSTSHRQTCYRGTLYLIIVKYTFLCILIGLAHLKGQMPEEKGMCFHNMLVLTAPLPTYTQTFVVVIRWPYKGQGRPTAF